MRRKFFEALDTAPRAQEVLDLILDVYRVEHEAKEKRIVGTKRHLALRQRKAKPTMSKLHAWLIDQRGHHPPRSVMGQALGYALNNWEAMICFLDNPKVPVDNNASERALRAIALGRKNYLFVGNEEAGKRVATLYSLVASCILNGVNPQAYLADVLLRVQSHPHADIDAILPNAWQPAA
jgi:transposase